MGSMQFTDHIHIADIVKSYVSARLTSTGQDRLLDVFTGLLALGRLLLVTKIRTRPSLQISCPQLTVNTKKIQILKVYVYETCYFTAQSAGDHIIIQTVTLACVWRITTSLRRLHQYSAVTIHYYSLFLVAEQKLNK